MTHCYVPPNLTQEEIARIEITRASKGARVAELICVFALVTAIVTAAVVSAAAN